MKYIFTLIFVCSFYISFSQMTVSEMMRIYNMDMDQFETFAINKGFKFKRTEDNENTFSVTYVKGFAPNTKYLSLDTRSYGVGKRVNYQTGNNNEYIIFKNSLASKGFKLSDTQTFNGSIKKTYTFNNWVFEIFSGFDDREYFEINLTKR